jgi:hypothetical protein
MQVICLRFEGMGTVEAALHIQRTSLMPLVDEGAFDALVQDEADKAYLRPLLFPDEDPPSDLPTDMLHLWALLHSSDADLGVLFFGGANQDATFIEKDRGKEYKIGELLGSGSQGLVYGLLGWYRRWGW